MKLSSLQSILCLAALTVPACFAQGDGSDLEKLKAQLADQQRQIESLKKSLIETEKTIENLSKAQEDTKAALDSAAAAVKTPTGSNTASDSLPAAPAKLGGDVASTNPVLSPPPPPAPRPSAYVPPQDATSSPLQVHLGNITIMPVGFMDLTAVFRNENAGSGIGSNFGSVPYNNSNNAHLSEFRFSPQNSRVGFRVDGDWKGAHFIGYNEFDFLGTSGNNALGVTNGAFVPRIRLYWVDVRKGQFEFLAGQSWSMLTPNRRGISPLPGDIFYSQVMDVNYVIGLTWTRQPGVRFIYHPNRKAAIGLALENPNQYIGGSGGGPTSVLPTALSSALAGSQLDNTTAGVLSTPNLSPDIIVKAAFDPTSRVHFEIAGIERNFKVYNPTAIQTFTKAGGGGSINGNFEVVKNFRLITNNYWSDGGGRYLFGNAPDLVVRTNGAISPIHSGGVVEGFEAQTKNTLWFGYYGAIYVGRDVVVDTNGSLVGYGYRGSANSQNRAVQEGTVGFVQTFWKDPKYGALSLIGQYEYLTRSPWYVAGGAPKAAHDNAIYMDVRYTLPGGAPPIPEK